MDRFWRLSHPDVLIYRRFDAPRTPGRMTAAIAATHVRDWLARQPHVMVEAHDAIVGRTLTVLRWTRDERRLLVERVLERAFYDGELVAFDVPVVFPLFEIERPLENVLGPQQPVEEVPEDTTWVAIELVDDSDPPAPVPFEAYELELADGSVLTGSLDADGRAKVDRVVRGPTKVRFPALDGSAWKLS